VRVKSRLPALTDSRWVSIILPPPTASDDILVFAIIADGLISRVFNMPDSQSPGAAAPPANKPDTGYIPGNDTWTQFRNIYSILTGKMSAEGIEQFRVARDIRNEAADCKRCEEQRDYLLQYSEWSEPNWEPWTLTFDWKAP
jgi:hypothetical protein